MWSYKRLGGEDNPNLNMICEIQLKMVGLNSHFWIIINILMLWNNTTNIKYLLNLCLYSSFRTECSLICLILLLIFGTYWRWEVDGAHIPCFINYGWPEAKHIIYFLQLLPQLILVTKFFIAFNLNHLKTQVLNSLKRCPHWGEMIVVSSVWYFNNNKVLPCDPHKKTCDTGKYFFSFNRMKNQH